MSYKKTPARPNDQSQWLILDGVENAARKKHLLGSIVPKSALYTLDNYRPHWDDGDLDSLAMQQQNVEGGKPRSKRDVLEETILKLWKKSGDFGKQEDEAGEELPVQLNDLLTGKTMATKRTSQASITKLVKAMTKMESTERVSIKSGSVKKYKIDNPVAKVQDNLFPCLPWKEQLQKLVDAAVKPKGTYMLITGIMVCEDLTITWDLTKDTQIEADAKLDGQLLLAAINAPLSADVAKYLDTYFEFKREVNNTQNVFATCKQDVILAIRYNYLNLEYEKETSSFLSKLIRNSKKGAIKNVKLGEPFCGTGINSYASTTVPHQSKEEEEDWFYTNPALDNDKEDQSNVQLNAHANGHTRPEESGLVNAQVNDNTEGQASAGAQTLNMRSMTGRLI